MFNRLRLILWRCVKYKIYTNLKERKPRRIDIKIEEKLHKVSKNKSYQRL